MNIQSYTSHDILWKGILKDFTLYMIRFFYPHLIEGRVIKEVIYLNKELQRVIKESDQNVRKVDTLAKIVYKNGEEQHFILHVEVQGYKDKTFPFRMFTYYYRIFDSQGGNILAIAIFTAPKAEPNSTVFEHSYEDTVIRLAYRNYSVWKEEDEKLEAMNNPFALVILAAKKAVEANNATDEQKLVFKLDLVNRLINKGYDRETSNNLYYFIINIINFSKEETYQTFFDEMEKLKPSLEEMGIVELVRQEAMKALEAKLEAKLKAKLEVKLEAKLKAKLEAKLEAKIDQERQRAETIFKEHQLTTAKKLLASDAFQHGAISVQIIAEVSGLTEEEVKALI